ncbi:uncharacterized protein LOC122381588 isoform X2 [Amphibalanus amphitrite]|uniref:uncharacterized protein LOC122381588 isoform X2 n=1 Tax=Amphibalanus amphitrite TaxID=1232801 RepID=UPI001C91B98E|nr:uncharacterized protein LOC122381588 isoform X2 [Amphibalanus amphitrite]
MAFLWAIFVSAVGLAIAESPVAPESPMPESSSQLKVWCNNVEEGEKLLIGRKNTTLQSACDLRAEITPAAVGSLVLAFAVQSLTDMGTSGSIHGTFLGVPKIYGLVNKTEEFTESNLFAIRSIELDDIPLSGMRAYLDGWCGTVYLLAALLNGSDTVDNTIITARMECPDETGVDLVPEVTADPSWRLDNYGALLFNPYETMNIPIRIAVRNNGSSALSARTDPDALRIWVYFKRNYLHSNNTIVPLNMSTFELMPSPGDVMISIDNIINRTRPGSPAIGAGSSVELTLTQLKLPEHQCGDGIIVISVDPLGEITDTQRGNNAVGIRVQSPCQADAGQCYVYGTPEPGVSLVALHHSYSSMPSNIIKLHAATAEIQRLPPAYMLTASQRLDMVKAVSLSHAIQAEANRLQDIGSCDGVSDLLYHGLSWEHSVLSRLSQGLVGAGEVISGVSAKSEFEYDQLRLLSTLASTIGQMLQQKGSLRTILSTIIHGDMSMFSHIPGIGGTPNSHEGSGGYDGSFGGGGYPGGGYPSGGYSGYPGGDSWSFHTAGGSGSFDYSSPGPRDYDYSGGYDYSAGGSRGYDYYGSGSGYDYDYSGSGSGDDYSYSIPRDYEFYGSGSGDYDYSYSGSGSGGYDYYGSGSGSDYDDYGSGSDSYDYYGSGYGSYDYYGSGYGSYDYSDYPDSLGDYTGDGGDASPLTLKRKKRFAPIPDIYPSDDGSGSMDSMEYSGDKPTWSPDKDQSWNDGMGGGMGGGMGYHPSTMMAPLVRIQLFFGTVMSYVARADYRGLRLPGCFPETFNDNFRRFVKALLWRTSPVQEIPGYEEVSDDFVANVRSMIKQFSSGVDIESALFMFRLPYEFDKAIERWIERRGGFNLMMPLQPDMIPGMLEEAVRIANNFTVYSWEGDVAMKNKSMVLLGKVASALLKTRRDEALDKFVQAFTQVHALLATGELAEVSGAPGMELNDNDICRRIVEMAVKEDAGGMNTPLLLMRDGDVYSVRPSPLTEELIWKKVVACECSPGGWSGVAF